MKKKIIYIITTFTFSILVVLFLIVYKPEMVGETVTETTEAETMIIAVDSLYFRKNSNTEIELIWSDRQDTFVENYIVKKRAVVEGSGTGEWEIIETVASDKTVDGREWSIADKLENFEPKQYEYRIDVELANAENKNAEESVSGNGAVIYEPAEGTPILASNVKICIDPGHFNKPGEVTEADEYAYVEGNFMLEVALELQQCLRHEYGIDSCLTRDSDTITLGGYTDDELDSAHIALRGEYAAEQDCDLFVSLHTNSNVENANGYETFFQPLAINKPIIILNTIALQSETAIRAANKIGQSLAKSNYGLGLSNTDEFLEVTADAIGEWSKEYNDGLDELGTVVIRTGKKNPDYYGVLRGATNVGIPGMIIEHGFHSVQAVRQIAADEDFEQIWAKADAKGIAYGFGFTK